VLRSWATTHGEFMQCWNVMSGLVFRS